MGISVNSRTSGFRKWSEAHDPKIVNAPAAAAAAAVIGPLPAGPAGARAVELDEPVRVSSHQRGTESSNPSSSSSQSVSAVNPEAIGEKPRTLAAVCGWLGT